MDKRIVGMCKLFGIDPPRELTRADVEKKYRAMPRVAAAVWANVADIQKAKK